MWETSGAIKTGSFSLDLISDKKEFCQTFRTEPWLQPPWTLGRESCSSGSQPRLHRLFYKGTSGQREGEMCPSWPRQGWVQMRRIPGAEGCEILLSLGWWW